MGLFEELYIRFHPNWVYHREKVEEEETELETGTKYFRQKMAVYRNTDTGEEIAVTYRPKTIQVEIEWDDGTETHVKGTKYM